MAVQLTLRTDRSEYTSGETVYGAVYLKISGPTSGYGVQIKFFGYETFTYVQKKDVLDAEWIQDTKEYIASDPTALYEFKDPIALGRYVFPFQKRLPVDLPGSSSLKSPDNSPSEWKVEIVYGVEASLMGAEEIKARQNFAVTQPLLETLSAPAVKSNEGFLETKSVSLHSWMPFILTSTDIRVCINSQQHQAGENLKLKIDIATTGVVKPRIENITFQLLRHLRITFKRLPSKDSDAKTHSSFAQTLRWLPSSENNLRLEDESNPENTLSSGFIHPEGTSFVVQQSRLVDIEGTKLINGIQELLIPLRDNQGRDLPATTLGSHIWLMYSLKVTTKFYRNDPVVLHVPICSVLPRFSVLSDWKPGDWVNDCQVMTSEDSPCFTSVEVRESENFSTLPSFRVA